MTLTASAYNAGYGYGGSPGPTTGGFATSVVGGAIGGGVFHVGGMFLNSVGRGLAGGIDSLGRGVANAMLPPPPMLAMAMGPQMVQAATRVAAVAARAGSPFAASGYAGLAGMGGSHIAMMASQRGGGGYNGVRSANPSNGAGKYLANNWHQGTFPNRTQSVRYHLTKHRKGRTATQ